MGVYVAMAIIAYFIGSISFGVILTKKFAGFDVRDKGSKGAGMTNVLRTAGKRLALITLVCDILKGVVAILIAMLLAWIFVDSVEVVTLNYIAGFFAILGHTFPIFFRFKGGKGVATAIGIMLLLNWQIGLICVVFGVTLMAITRMVSVGSILSAILYPVLTLMLGEGLIAFLGSLMIGLLVVFNHRQNIQRLRNGTENKLGQKVK
ncbi:MAG: glycerol-3-phosphate 1-O-acyltransferase PlsY [Oscillospiraceae bacterium]|nr:glycerol-3-phosphate 1-O-acyltransferase PlsY [Oscillospiraceae bacterium]